MALPLRRPDHPAPRAAAPSGDERRSARGTLPEGDDADWFSLNRLALGGTILWALGAGDRLTRIDTAGDGPAAQVPDVTASTVAASDDGAWALKQRPRGYLLIHVSHAGRVTARVPLLATDLDGIDAGAGAVWITAPQDGLLWRVTPDAARSIDVGPGARGVAVADGKVWVANAARGTVTRVDPRSQPAPTRSSGSETLPGRWRGRRAALGQRRSRWRRRAGARRRARRQRRGHRARLRRGDRGRRHAAAADRVGYAAAPARDASSTRTRSRPCFAATTSARAASASATSRATTRPPSRAASSSRSAGRTRACTQTRSASSASSARTTRTAPLSSSRSPTAPARSRRSHRRTRGSRSHQAAARREAGELDRKLLPDRAPSLRPPAGLRQRPGRCAALFATNAAFGGSRSCRPTRNTGARTRGTPAREARRLGIRVTGVHTIDFMGTPARACARTARRPRTARCADLRGVPDWGLDREGAARLRAAQRAARALEMLLILGPIPSTSARSSSPGSGRRRATTSAPRSPAPAPRATGRRFSTSSARRSPARS